MDTNQLKLSDLIKLIIKEKFLFLIIFISIIITSIFFISNIEKTYKSTLSVSLPLKQGVETKYTLENFSALKGSEINALLELKTETKVSKIEISNFQPTHESIFADINLITTKPDTEHVVKDAFVNYISNLSYIKDLQTQEIQKYNEIIESAKNEYKRLSKEEDIDLKPYALVGNFLNPVEIIEQKHNAQFNLKNSKAIVEILYIPQIKKYKPSYAMLTLLSIVFSFFVAFTIIVTKVFFVEFFKNEIH